MSGSWIEGQHCGRVERFVRKVLNPLSYSAAWGIFLEHLRLGPSLVRRRHGGGRTRCAPRPRVPIPPAVHLIPLAVHRVPSGAQIRRTTWW